MLKKITGSVALAMALSCSPALAQDYELTFQSSDSPGIFMYQMAENYGKWVDEMSEGRVKISVAPVGSVVQYNETLDAVTSGILQGEFTDPSYFAGLDPAFGLIGNTVGAFGHPSEALKFLNYGGGKEIFQKLYDKYNVHLIGVVITGVEAFVSAKPLNGVDDLKGLKMRAPEGMVQKVFAAAGAAPVNLPGSEVYTSLEKGVIDAADYTLFSVNQQQGMHKIGKYPVFPGFHSMPLQVVTINKDIWNELPESIQTMMETAVWRLATEVYFQYEMLDLEAAAQARAEGIQISDWSLEERAKFRNIAREQWESVTSQSPIAKEYADALVTFMQSQGLM
ncbi:MAG TPA: C4-dicarboxylate ABC transporter substrate-binding protein [Desulfofustis sp.]|jgi:TRAP-type C4-dicarboxylate transport system substrate-binding protein|nr:TRAP transporter substrate-binding protein [Desulfofustis sp. PB-SRB1]HBH27536.1 C4-dicarboxylate ABC transporter substrate-binding protein [Desulfofustis sp.]HBH31932.1 C4-dicarboxylate ABC transporter substrate-binding protein [Desulfofustis sp.]